MTADEDTLKKLPIGGILKASWQYFCDNGKMMLAFTLINFATLVSGVYSWKTAFFWLAAAVAYVFWSYFFRFYFNRRPYLEWQPIVSSMIPSTNCGAQRFVCHDFNCIAVCSFVYGIFGRIF